VGRAGGRAPRGRRSGLVGADKREARGDVAGSGCAVFDFAGIVGATKNRSPQPANIDTPLRASGGDREVGEDQEHSEDGGWADKKDDDEWEEEEDVCIDVSKFVGRRHPQLHSPGQLVPVNFSSRRYPLHHRSRFRIPTPFPRTVHRRGNVRPGVGCGVGKVEQQPPREINYAIQDDLFRSPCLRRWEKKTEQVRTQQTTFKAISQSAVPSNNLYLVKPGRHCEGDRRGRGRV